MNIVIQKKSQHLMLCYSPSRSDRWIIEHIENNDPIRLKTNESGGAVFIFEKGDLISKEPNLDSNSEFEVDLTEDVSRINHIWNFRLGTRDDNGYYRIPARILSSGHDVLIHADVEVVLDFFMTSVLNTSIIPIIDRMINTPLIIGGEMEEAMPEEEYKAIVKMVPNRKELHLYAQSRIEGILSEYVSSTKESCMELSRYIERKYNRTKHGLVKPRLDVDIAIDYIREIDRSRVKFTLTRLQELLDSAAKLTERQWQEEIEKIILLLLPEYVAKVSQQKIHDSLNERNCRIPDILLVSMSGNVDVVEIKRPDICHLISRRPNYRGNYIPSRDLSATVMQAEKYLIDIVRWGRVGEQKISKCFNIGEVKIRHPKAILILGRNAELDNDQKKSDFEIIKRKFANVVDIITYDDLLDRLKNVLVQLESHNLRK